MMASATLIAPTERLAPPEQLVPSAKLDSRRTYSCPECGHVLRVTGLGRHRVYFELTDELLDDPVMDRACPACEQALCCPRCRLRFTPAAARSRALSRARHGPLAERWTLGRLPEPGQTPPKPGHAHGEVR